MTPSISFPEWQKEYERIASRLGLDIGKDREAARLLSRLLSKRKDLVPEASSRISGRDACVYGAGPSLEKAPVRAPCIAADGATSYILEKGKVPDIIVTDLDGKMTDILAASRRGALVFVHGHSDNMDRLVRYVPRLPNVVGTVQTEPEDNVHNFGGFTDGDRALFLARALGASGARCFGFDFGEVVGKYSKPRLRRSVMASPRKREKLRIARELVEKYQLCGAYI